MAAALRAEVAHNADNVRLLLNRMLAGPLGLALSEYGSTNLGPKGAKYKLVQKVLDDTRNHAGAEDLFPEAELPRVRDYLTPPLSAYDPNESKAGGAGRNKKRLARCLRKLKSRVYRCFGMLDALQGLRPQFSAELTSYRDESLLLLNAMYVVLFLQLGVGEYGSVNVGRKGILYKRVQNVLSDTRRAHGAENARVRTNEQPQLQQLRAYLTEDRLLRYDPNESKAGGKGQNKLALAQCLTKVNERIWRCVGMLEVLHGFGVDDMIAGFENLRIV